MKHSRPTLNFSKISLINSSAIIAILSIIAGIIVGVFALSSAYQELNSEHHEHLESLVWSSDRNLDNLFEHCRQELEEECAEYGYDDIERIQSKFASSEILLDDKFDVVVLLRDSKLISSSDLDVHHITFPKNYSCDYPCLCTDNNRNNYLAIVEETANHSIDIAVLLRLDRLFEKFVGNELRDYYWMALYDVNNELCIQDDVTQPYVKNISYEAALKRNDGITTMAKSERAGTLLSGEYEFKSESTDMTKFIITSLPTAINDNGYFTLGLSVPTEHYQSILTDIFWRTAICGALILFGFLVIFLLAHKRRRDNEAMLADISLLREKNETMQHLMETSQELSHQQRLVTIGTIASNVNHEFSNLLTPIMGYSVLAMEKAGGDEELMEYLEKIYEASSRAKTLVARLLKMSRKGNNLERTLISPDELLDKVETILLPSLPKKLTIEKDYHCPDLCLLASENHMEQALVNIILNAFQAMSDKGGTLYISTDRDSQWVEIILKDDGPGIEDDKIESIFEPFYSTKEDNSGTGLGLAIVRQIVEAHHGHINVESHIGLGTTFVIKLPLYVEK